jgi:hypothetical protein
MHDHPEFDQMGQLFAPQVTVNLLIDTEFLSDGNQWLGRMAVATEAQ